MYKKIFYFFSILFFVFSTGCTIWKNAEDPVGKVVVLKDSFYVVFNKNFKPEDAAKASVTGEVPGKKHTFSLTEKKEFDLKNICSSYTPIKDAAIVSFVVYSLRSESTTIPLINLRNFFLSCKSLNPTARIYLCNDFTPFM